MTSDGSDLRRGAQEPVADPAPRLVECHRRGARRPRRRPVAGPVGRDPMGSLPEVIQRLDEELRTARLPRAQRAEIMTTAWLLSGLRVSKPQANRLFSGVAIMRESTTDRA